MISKKVILTGSFGVGKTSLFNRFIYSIFSEKYLTTIGVKVNKKTVQIDDHDLTMLIWDIAGEVTQDKVPVSYFLGTSGIVYVFDLTRPTTTKNLHADLDYLRKIVPDVTIKVVGNKKDLVTEAQIAQFLQDNGIYADCLTSAKSGDGVEELFMLLGRDMLTE